MRLGPIALVPIGEVPQDLMRWLESAMDANVSLRDPVPLSRDWIDDGRQQVRGPALLQALRRVPRPEQGRILGLVDVDCYAPGLNFIFGQADPSALAAFVALPRLRPSFYGPRRDLELFRQRALKEAVHELGHTWGLGHCPNPRCVMHFSNTLADTDVKGATFCERCRRRLRARGAS